MHNPFKNIHLTYNIRKRAIRMIMYHFSWTYIRLLQINYIPFFSHYLYYTSSFLRVRYQLQVAVYAKLSLFSYTELSNELFWHKLTLILTSWDVQHDISRTVIIDLIVVYLNWSLCYICKFNAVYFLYYLRHGNMYRPTTHELYLQNIIIKKIYMCERAWKIPP